jgi:hypothetical protein
MSLAAAAGQAVAADAGGPRMAGWRVLLRVAVFSKNPGGEIQWLASVCREEVLPFEPRDGLRVEWCEDTCNCRAEGGEVGWSLPHAQWAVDFNDDWSGSGASMRGVLEHYVAQGWTEEEGSFSEEDACSAANGAAGEGE